jgi:16S rRNA (adenine1518-N6/adenine1519-N6)-dimethyltransferase
MRLLAEHGLRPDTDLGQHFLLDENLVDLAVREAALVPADVVLEVGAGLGVLTVALARAASHVHAVELDRRLETALTDALTGLGNVSLNWADVMKLDWEALTPPPTALVANLPYDIATPLMLESLWRLPSLERWCVMVQREVADRWLAEPGSRQYGGPSVLLRLSLEATFRRQVGREVFVPRPRVDSALVAFRRIAPAPSPHVRRVVRAAFASRRKTLANALSQSGCEKAEAARALAAVGLPAAVRPEQVSPPDFARLAEELQWSG